MDPEVTSGLLTPQRLASRAALGEKLGPLSKTVLMPTYAQGVTCCGGQGDFGAGTKSGQHVQKLLISGDSSKALRAAAAMQLKRLKTR